MQQVKIKNINESLLNKTFVVKGRVKFCRVFLKKKKEQCSAIIFDNISEIEVVAFENCENYAKELPKDRVVMIENVKKTKTNKDYKRTNHKYRLTLRDYSKVTPIDNDKVNISDFPLHKYTSGPDLKTLRSGMIIDSTIELPDQKLSISSIIQSNNNSTIELPEQRLSTSSVTQTYRISDLVDESIYERPSTSGSTTSKKRKTHDFLVEEVTPKIQKKTEPGEAFSDERFGNMVINFMQVVNNVIVQKPSISSIIQSNNNSTIELPDQKPLTSSIIQSNNNSTIELPDQKPSISSIIQSNNNSTIELPKQRLSTSIVTQSYRISDLVDESIDERPSTSGSTTSKKRKTHDFLVEEVTSKIQKKTEPGEAFSDERFSNMVINFMQLVNNNKLVKQMQILEFVSNIVKEDEK